MYPTPPRRGADPVPLAVIQIDMHAPPSRSGQGRARARARSGTERRGVLRRPHRPRQRIGRALLDWVGARCHPSVHPSSQPRRSRHRSITEGPPGACAGRAGAARGCMRLREGGGDQWIPLEIGPGGWVCVFG
eukprot:scaffold2640_cov376-Prasinococcus_capsulatus_cf.AAC.8